MDKYQFGFFIYYVVSGLINVIMELIWDKKHKLDWFKIAGLGFSFMIGWILIPLYIFKGINKKYEG